MDEHGEVHRIGCPKGKVVNSVGAGDSMVAGFVAGYLQSGGYEQALRLGTACGSATAFSLGLATKEKIEELFGQDCEAVTLSVIANAMPPLPKGEAIALPDSTSADLGDALAPPLGELSKPCRL